MRKRTPQRAIGFSLFIAALTFYNFTRIQNSEGVRAIHIVSLLVCGVAIGVALTNLFILLREKNQ